MQTSKVLAPIPDWRYPRDPGMCGQVERDLEIDNHGIWSYTTYIVDSENENRRYLLNSMHIGTRPFIVEAALRGFTLQPAETVSLFSSYRR